MTYSMFNVTRSVRIAPPKINYNSEVAGLEPRFGSFRGTSSAAYMTEQPEAQQPDALAAIVGVAETAPPWFVQASKHYYFG